MYQFKPFFIFLCLLFVMSSCGPRSLDDFQEEAEGIIRSLIQDLRAIHTREQLLAATGRLQKQFDRLVSVMIAAEEFRFFHPELEKEENIRPSHELSDLLRVELNRIYRLEGGRTLIEKCQEKALYRLDAFEKHHANQKIP